MTTSPEPQAVAERELCGLVNGLAQQIAVHVRERAVTLGLTAAQAQHRVHLHGHQVPWRWNEATETVTPA
ncbi:hypothetical protein ABZW49_37755 [Nonomuraea wenchangensis]